MKFGIGTILKHSSGTRYLVCSVDNNKANLINMKHGSRWNNPIDYVYDTEFELSDFIDRNLGNWEIFRLGSER